MKRTPLPTTGHFTPKRLAKLLGASKRTILTTCRRFNIPARPQIDISVWYARLIESEAQV